MEKLREYRFDEGVIKTTKEKIGESGTLIIFSDMSSVDLKRGTIINKRSNEPLVFEKKDFSKDNETKTTKTESAETPKKDGVKQSASTPTTSEPPSADNKKVFDGIRNLDIDNCFGVVNIVRHDAKAIVSAKKEDFEISLSGDTLIIKQKAGNDNMNISSFSSISGSNVCINGISIRGSSGSIFVNGRRVSVNNDQEEKEIPKISIAVPSGTNINISERAGTTRVNNIYGNIRVNLVEGGDVFIGNTISAKLHVQGSGTIEVSNVTGDLDASCQGSGDIKVLNGEVNSLNASVQGSGDITFRGIAKDAYLRVMGSGDIKVTKVTGNLRRNVAGSGEIHVGNR